MDGIHAHTYTHTRTHIHTHTVHIRAYIRMHTHTYLRTYVHACMHTYMYACIRTYIHTYTHKYIHTYTHTRIHACIHTYIHSHVHAPTQIKNGDFCAHVHQHSQALLKSTSSLLRSDSLTDRAIAIAVGEKTFMSAHSTWRQAQMRAHECLNKDSLSHMQPEHPKGNDKRRQQMSEK